MVVSSPRGLPADSLRGLRRPCRGLTTTEKKDHPFFSVVAHLPRRGSVRSPLHRYIAANSFFTGRRGAPSSFHSGSHSGSGNDQDCAGTSALPPLRGSVPLLDGLLEREARLRRRTPICQKCQNLSEVLRPLSDTLLCYYQSLRSIVRKNGGGGGVF